MRNNEFGDTIEVTYPLSPMQHGMLFHQVVERAPGVDIEQIVGELPEPLVVPVFERAWRRVVERHAVLRTSFHWRDRAEPLQVVHRAVALTLAQEDWRGVPESTQAERLTAYLAADRQQGFALDRPPLLRVALFRLADERYQLIWTFPHLVLDGRSFLPVLNEVFALYAAEVEGRPLSLPPAVPYRLHIDWLSRQDWSAAEPFWRAQLSGFNAPTPLPGERPLAERLAAPVDYQRHSHSLSAAITAGLRRLAADHGLTLNTLVQAAWAIALARSSGVDEVVFGATRAARHSSVPEAESIVGLFINTLPLRVPLAPATPLLPWLAALRAQQLAVRPYEQTPLVQIQGWSAVPNDQPLFESIVVYDHQQLGTALRAQGGAWRRRDFQLLEQTSFPLTLYAYGEPALHLTLAFDSQRLEPAAIEHLLERLTTVLTGLAEAPPATLDELLALTATERRQLLVEWNATAQPYDRQATIHGLIEAQVARTPAATAVIFADQRLSYAELDERATRLANHLRATGVGPGQLVGLASERSPEMMVALLGILKAGAAYLPLDPSYPSERLAFKIEDSQIAALLTQTTLLDRLPHYAGPIICLDRDWPLVAAANADRPVSGVTGTDLAYVIYTSGSTGRPKGVMVSHRNVVNFFVGMDERLDYRGEPGVWLAVTSISFDISVLELFWTLARGFTVVIQPAETQSRRVALVEPPTRPLEFSLFYFASATVADDDRYRLLIEGAKFADRHGFTAVWTPERHFHEFGGLYPSPAITSAALAMVTERIQLRAGSVVLPLQNTLRVAEEWSMVDNLSRGRVGVACASGWHADDFALAPANFGERKAIMHEQITAVQALWRGETITVRNGLDQPIAVRIFPRPVQPTLPLWLTAAGASETFAAAGALGANVLTHLLGQEIERLADNIRLYRQARQAHGHDPATGRVTLMLHTFIGEDLDSTREAVRQPLIQYLKSSASLVRSLARGLGHQLAEGDLSDAEMDAFLTARFDRYFETSGLMGTVESCLATLERLKAIDVDEIACLIDFGVATETVLASLPRLVTLMERSNTPVAVAAGDHSIPAQIRRHGVTHLQCTPSLAALLADEPGTLANLRPLRRLLIGGEAFPPALAARLVAAIDGQVLNMYGPTETTVWSTTQAVAGDGQAVPIGRPIANTTIYLLDAEQRPVPVGVAGELYIGGDGVTPGYLNRPELTAERFVPDPFGAAGQRLYRTGDLARYRADGTLEFLGRLDQQVKLHGHRIELGEIEAALSEQATVREAVVIAREDEPGERRLVAYLLSAAGPPAAVGALREALRQRLPDHMLPAAFVWLERFPLTPNGKIDRRALPAPERGRAAIETAYAPPVDDLEAAITAVWQMALRLERVGRHDNFFDLGANSLMILQLSSRLEAAAGRPVALIDIFRHPTVALLAAFLAQDGAAARPETAATANRIQMRREAALRRQQMRPMHRT